MERLAHYSSKADIIELKKESVPGNPPLLIKRKELLRLEDAGR